MYNTSHTSPCCRKRCFPSLELYFYIFFRSFLVHVFFFFSGDFFFFCIPPPLCVFPTPQQGFKWCDVGWYRGEHVNQVPHGMGRVDGDDEYTIAEYKDGKRNGHSTRYRANGKIWRESNWIDGKQHGHVTEFKPDGSISGEWDFILGVQQ